MFDGLKAKVKRLFSSQGKIDDLNDLLKHNQELKLIASQKQEAVSVKSNLQSQTTEGNEQKYRTEKTLLYAVGKRIVQNSKIFGKHYTECDHSEGMVIEAYKHITNNLCMGCGSNLAVTIEGIELANGKFYPSQYTKTLYRSLYFRGAIPDIEPEPEI